MYDHILFETTDDVAFIRFNDPATLNAMTTVMGLELVDAFGKAETTARAIVLGGVGRAFCSGANLTGGAFNVDDPDRDAGLALEKALNPFVAKIRRSRIPVISAVRGAAAGVGCGIALAADLIVAGEGAYFFQAFGKVGLSPDGGSTYLLAKAIGRVRAMEMMLLGAKLPASRALDWGLINRVVPDAEVDDAALELGRQLASGPRSLGMIRTAAWAALDGTLEDALETERKTQRDAGRTEDFLEGLAAFKAKRNPVFKGC